MRKKLSAIDMYWILVFLVAVSILDIVGRNEISVSAEENLEGDIISRERRILGGTLQLVENFPYIVQVQLYFDDRIATCGGSILSNEWVITAAHCLMHPTDRIVVRAGTSRILSDEYGTTHSVIKGIFYKTYNKTNGEDDIVLLKIKPAFKWNRMCQPIKLIEEDEVVRDDDFAIASGFGMSAGEYSHGLITDFTLRSVKLPIYDTEKCAGLYSNFRHYKVQKILCAGYKGIETQKAVCFGDSGGPLVLDGRLIGITSYGVSCEGMLRSPSVFTRISAYREWIILNMYLNGDEGRTKQHFNCAGCDISPIECSPNEIL